jgi:hypothetical protein
LRKSSISVVSIACFLDEEGCRVIVGAAGLDVDGDEKKDAQMICLNLLGTTRSGDARSLIDDELEK